MVEKGDDREAVRGIAAGRDCGVVFTDIVAWFIIVVCAATLYKHGMRTSTRLPMRRRR